MMVTTATKKGTRGSGSARTSGAPFARASKPAAIAEPSALTDEDVVLTEEEVFDLLKVIPEQRRAEILEKCPGFIVGTARRYLKSQVITWAALGGAQPRHQRKHARMEF